MEKSWLGYSLGGSVIVVVIACAHICAECHMRAAGLSLPSWQSPLAPFSKALCACYLTLFETRDLFYHFSKASCIFLAKDKTKSAIVSNKLNVLTTKSPKIKFKVI